MKLLKAKTFLFVVAPLLGLYTTSVDARLPHGGQAIPTSAPLLVNQTVNFGALTRTTYGEVRLSGQDVTTTADHPVTFSGIDLMSPSAPPCAIWTMTYVGNTVGRPSTDFTIISAGTAEGPNAVTPQVASGGQNNLAGTYTWNVSCVGGDGATSNTAQLQYVTVANAVNVGDTDRTDFGVYPSGFGNVAGAQIFFSTGMDRSTTRFDFRSAANFTNQVVLQDADPTRHSKLTNLSISSISNLKVKGLRFSGSQAAAVAATAGCTFCGQGPNGTTYTNLIFEDDIGYFSEALMAHTTSHSWGAFRVDGCLSGCQIINSGVDYTESGLSTGTQTVAVVTNSWIRHSYVNCITFGNSGNTSGAGWDINDSMCFSPNTNDDHHPDFGQISDNATPFNTNVKHFIQAQAGGDDNAQGLPFGGGPVGVNDAIKGYVSAGAGNTNPGKVLTLTSGAFGYAANSSRIWSPAGSPLALTDFVQMTCPSSCTNATSANLSLAADTNLGSAASPITIYGTAAYNFNVNGLIYNSGQFIGAYWTGENGNSSYTNYAVINNPANPFYETNFTGTISGGNVLTVAGPITNTVPTAVPPFWIGGYYANSGGRLKYTGCNYCSSSAGINIQLTGPTNGAGTYRTYGTLADIGPVPMSTSFSSPVAGGGNVYMINCSTPNLHGGTLTIDSGYSNALSLSTCPNVTATNTLLQSTIVAADYASGQLPVDYLGAIPASTWATMDFDAVRTKQCLAFKPAIGGHLDLGGGAWLGPITGESNVNGTGGGDWTAKNTHISDGTHIAGCEATP